MSDDVSTPVGDDGYTTSRTVNAINQVTSVVEDPYQLPSVHTTTTAYSYDARGNRTSEVTTRATGSATHVLGKVTHTFDGMDLLASTTDAGSNLSSAKDDSTTAWVRDGLGRALTVSVGGAARQRTYDGLAVVSDGATALTRDPSGGVLTEATTKTVLQGKTASTVTSTVDVLTDVLGSTVSVATAGVISADLAVFTDFGQPLTTPRWDTVSGFTGQVDTSGVLEFAARTFDPASKVWLQDDSYRGTAARSASLNRYGYVEGAPETFVDALGFHRAAAALQQQLLAAKEAAKAAKAAAAQLLFMRTPTCTGYYGCYTNELYQQTLQRNYSAIRSAGAYQSGFVGIGGVCSGSAACEGIRRGKNTVVLDDVTYPLPAGVTRGQLEDSCENDYVCMAKGVGLIQSGLPDTASRIVWGAVGGVADVWDRGSTWVQYEAQATWRRVKNPGQTIVDYVSFTLFAEDAVASAQILGGDAELLNQGDYCGTVGECLIGGFTPKDEEGRTQAFTIGHTVSFGDIVQPKEEHIKHEFTHVRQYEALGGLGFGLDYGGEYLYRTTVLGEDKPTAYYNLMLERNARAVADDPNVRP